MKKKVDIFSLIVSIIGTLCSAYFLFKMVQVVVLGNKLTIIPFIYHIIILLLGIINLIISICFITFKREKYNIIPCAIITSIGIIMNICNFIMMYPIFN